MKRNSVIFIVLFVFFVVVAAGALFMLNDSGSVFNRDAKSIGAQTAVMSQTVVGDEPVQEISVVEETEVVTDAGDTETDTTADAATDAAAEETSAAEAEPESGGEIVREKRYFTFSTSTKHTVLRMREAPSEEATITHKLGRKTPGYVLQPGNVWSKVITNQGSVGFCATEYLDMTEVTVDDYPKEIAEMVEAPEEDLNY